MIASLEVDCNRRVWKVLQVDSEHLLGDVVIVQLVVAECNIHVECQVFSGAASVKQVTVKYIVAQLRQNKMLVWALLSLQ